MNWNKKKLEAFFLHKFSSWMSFLQPWDDRIARWIIIWWIIANHKTKLKINTVEWWSKMEGKVEKRHRENFAVKLTTNLNSHRTSLQRPSDIIEVQVQNKAISIFHQIKIWAGKRELWTAKLRFKDGKVIRKRVGIRRNSVLSGRIMNIEIFHFC